MRFGVKQFDYAAHYGLHDSDRSYKMRRQLQSEQERAQAERTKLAEQEQPSFDPSRDCDRCFGTNYEQRKGEDGYVTAIPCDHKPIPF
jgi:hypothetical protein